MTNDVQILNNGYPMPAVGLGVYKIADEQMEEVVRTALDAGYRAFDTAYFYGNEKALEHLYEEGKIKAIGVCNFKIHHLEKLMKETKITPQVNQIELHPYFNQQDVQDFCDEHDIKVTAWMPLMRNKGLLDDPVITDIAHRYDKTPAQIVLRWHLAHNRIIIPKSQTPKRIKENFDIFDFNLELTDVAEIDSLNKNARQGKDPDDVSIGDLK